MVGQNTPPEGRSAVARYIVPVLFFSFVINALYLVGPIYMMQVYDRVLSSGSVPTLVGLSLIAGLLYIFFGFMDYTRSQLLAVRGEAFAQSLAKKAFSQSLDGYALDTPSSSRRNAIEDVAMTRGFLVSNGFTAMIDLMWMPIFLAFIFVLHTILGATAVVAAGFLVILAVINERSSRNATKTDGQLKQTANRWAGQVQRQAPSILGNGMKAAMLERWYDQEQVARKSTNKIMAKSAKFTTMTKTSRLMIQSAILGIGGYLAIQQEISPGAMIAASIVFSRTIAPIEQLLGNFQQLLQAKDAWGRIKTWKSADSEREKVTLPAPSRELQAHIQGLTPPDSPVTVLQNAQIKLNAGDVLGVIGPSGGGKSSLSKALCGAWVPSKGLVTLDGADLREWPRVQLSQAIGYMPQDAELFDGTIAENISGFRKDATSEAIIEACVLAGAHDLILSLPNSYNTKVGPVGLKLSAGQRQRISFARALYGNPFVVILDEPNSNLDEAGERALENALRTLKANNKIAVVIAHRQDVLKEATHLCVIENAVMKIFGPKDAVNARLQQNTAKAATKTSTTDQPRRLTEAQLAVHRNAAAQAQQPLHAMSSQPTRAAGYGSSSRQNSPSNRPPQHSSVPANPYAPAAFPASTNTAVG